MRMPNIGLGVASFIIPAARGRLECRRVSWGIAPLRDRVDVSQPSGGGKHAERQVTPSANGFAPRWGSESRYLLLVLTPFLRRSGGGTL